MGTSLLASARARNKLLTGEEMRVDGAAEPTFLPHAACHTGASCVEYQQWWIQNLIFRGSLSPLATALVSANY